jgi:hypothetical protein
MKQAAACLMLYSCSGLLFHSDGGDDTFFWNVHWLFTLHCNKAQNTDSDTHTYSSKRCLALVLKDHVHQLQAWKGKLALWYHLMFSFSVLLESERNKAICKLLPVSCWFLALVYPSSLKMEDIFLHMSFNFQNICYILEAEFFIATIVNTSNATYIVPTSSLNINWLLFFCGSEPHLIKH